MSVMSECGLGGISERGSGVVSFADLGVGDGVHDALLVSDRGGGCCSGC